MAALAGLTGPAGLAVRLWKARVAQVVAAA
jgi:hypothetical protein